MNWEELLKRAPKLEAYIKHMPPDIKARSVIKVIPPDRLSTRRITSWTILHLSAAEITGPSMNLKTVTYI